MSAGFAQLTATPDAAAPDPSKHVKYTLGMLLGVDDFNQEFAYLSGRDQSLARNLIGYGTTCGLRVTADTTVKGPRVSVTSGTALSPRGQTICVRPAQCAYLNDWLIANPGVMPLQAGSPPHPIVKLHLTVCYRDCPVDAAPIAGEPCRSAEDLMAPSRLLDDFRLELRLAPPQQQEEDAVRDFVAWLDQVQIADIGPFTALPDFVGALRAALVPGASPLDAAAFFHFGSPLTGIRVHTSDAGDFLRAAFRIWVTEIRPVFHAAWPDQGCSCGADAAGAPEPDECLLLAELEVPLVNIGPGQNWRVDDLRPVSIDESRRPILLHARMLQEWTQSGLWKGK